MSNLAMKITTFLFFGLFILSGCMDGPEFSDTPKIEYQDVLFKVSGSSSADSLIIVLKFEDGDGDLGLDDRTEFVTGDFRQGDFFQSPDGNSLLTIKDLGQISGLPEYELPYSCTNWIERPTFQAFCLQANIPSANCESIVTSLELDVINNDNTQIIDDTLYYEPNPNHVNMDFKFLYKDTDGEFKEFNWVTDIPNPCGAPSLLRFPVLSDPGSNSPIEGILRYGFTSSGLLPLFDGKELKLKVKIKDRALHESNEIETPVFTLRGIQAN